MKFYRQGFSRVGSLLNLAGSDRVRITRPDPTRPLRFRTPFDPSRLDRPAFENILTGPASRVMAHEKHTFFAAQ